MRRVRTPMLKRVGLWIVMYQSARAAPDPQPTVRIRDQRSDSALRQTAGVVLNGPIDLKAVAVEARDTAAIGDPKETLRVLRDSVDAAFGQTARIDVLEDRIGEVGPG